MLLERTLLQLDIGPVPAGQAEELGALGFMQWLAGLPAGSSYRQEALRACAAAQPLMRASPAVGVFHDLVAESLKRPLQPLPLVLAAGGRRGGAPARRRQRML